MASMLMLPSGITNTPDRRLALRRQVLLRDHRHARQVLADFFLRGLVQRGLFLVVHGDQGLGQRELSTTSLL
jgi:hypothetical protein